MGAVETHWRFPDSEKSRPDPNACLHIPLLPLKRALFPEIGGCSHTKAEQEQQGGRQEGHKGVSLNQEDMTHVTVSQQSNNEMNMSIF